MDAERSDQVVRNRPGRALWFVGGWVAVGVGGIGVVVPGLPTTGFLIIAASCFARSSPRFEQWVLDLPKFGPMVRDYRAGLGMPYRAKVWAIGMIVVMSVISGTFALSGLVPRLILFVVALAGVGYIAYRVPTRETVLDL